MFVKINMKIFEFMGQFSDEGEKPTGAWGVNGVEFKNVRFVNTGKRRENEIELLIVLSGSAAAWRSGFQNVSVCNVCIYDS
jgi:hypothetical protein